MSNTRHGLSIGIETVHSNIFLSLKATGKLTHEDYQIITPMLEAALGSVQSPKVKVHIDATELQGWEARSAWDDFKLGLKHGNQFDKIAIYGNKNWQQISARIGSWFIAGEVSYFDNKDDALSWLNN